MAHAQAYTTVCMCQSNNYFQEWVLSFHHVGSGTELRASDLTASVDPLSHLTGPTVYNSEEKLLNYVCYKIELRLKYN